MNYKTHLAFGFLLGYLAFQYISTNNIYVFFAFVLIGAFLPDIDFSGSKIGKKFRITSFLIEKLFRHRGIFHSLFTAILLSVVVFIFTNKIYALAFFIGYLSHLISDGLTKTGINFLHPFMNLRLTGFIETNSFSETLFFVSILAIIVFLQLI